MSPLCDSVSLSTLGHPYYQPSSRQELCICTVSNTLRPQSRLGLQEYKIIISVAACEQNWLVAGGEAGGAAFLCSKAAT